MAAGGDAGGDAARVVEFFAAGSVEFFVTGGVEAASFDGGGEVELVVLFVSRWVESSSTCI